MYFLAIEITSRRLASIISFLALADHFAFLHGSDNTTEFRNGETYFISNLCDFSTDVFDLITVLLKIFNPYRLIGTLD